MMDLEMCIDVLKEIRETNFSNQLTAGILRNNALDYAIEALEKEMSEIKVNILDQVSQYLQDNGFEDASKALDCKYDL